METLATQAKEPQDISLRGGQHNSEDFFLIALMAGIKKVQGRREFQPREN